jgi:hypothetical protein
MKRDLYGQLCTDPVLVNFSVARDRKVMATLQQSENDKTLLETKYGE